MAFVFFVFLILKLVSVFNIPWWAVFAPLWIPSCIASLALSLSLIVMVVKDKMTKKYIVKELEDEG